MDPGGSTGGHPWSTGGHPSGRFPRVRSDSDPRIDDRFRGSAVDFCRTGDLLTKANFQFSAGVYIFTNPRHHLGEGGDPHQSDPAVFDVKNCGIIPGITCLELLLDANSWDCLLGLSYETLPKLFGEGGEGGGDPTLASTAVFDVVSRSKIAEHPCGFKREKKLTTRTGKQFSLG